MSTPAPVRDPSRSSFKSPLKKAARRIVTAPTFNVVRTLDFDKKSEYEKFIKFISASNRELAKIKLPKPGLNKAISTALPIFQPDMTVKGTSLKLSIFKKIADMWKQFVRWFKRSPVGRWLRNRYAQIKKIWKSVRSTWKRIWNIDWKGLIDKAKKSRIGRLIKGSFDWLKKPKKLPKWAKESWKSLREGWKKLGNVDWGQVFNIFGWVRSIFNWTPKGFIISSIFNDIFNRGTAQYVMMQGENAYFNDPVLKKAEDVYSEVVLRHGKEIANNLEALKEMGMKADMLEKYEEFLNYKNQVQKEYSSEYSNLNTKSSIDAELAELKEKILRLSSEQLQMNYNPKDTINPGRQWRYNAEEIEKLLGKSKYLELKKRELYDNKLNTEQSNSQLDLSQIFSMDSSVLPSSYSDSFSESFVLNNAPELYVMNKEGETQYIPFSSGTSSNNSGSSMMDFNYSQFNSEILDELKFIKLSGG